MSGYIAHELSALFSLVHATSYVSQRDMMRAGLRLNIVDILVITVLFHFGVAG